MAVWEKLPDLAEPEKHILSLEILLFYLENVQIKSTERQQTWAQPQYEFGVLSLVIINSTLYFLLDSWFVVIHSILVRCLDVKETRVPVHSKGLHWGWIRFKALCKSLQHEQGSKLTTNKTIKLLMMVSETLDDGDGGNCIMQGLTSKVKSTLYAQKPCYAEATRS